MADRYWIATGSVKNANTASYWNTAADGSGSTGVPTTNDTVIFGHDDSFTNNLGTAPCRWDLAVTLTRFQSNAQHYKDLSVVSSTISFNSTGNVISMGNEGFNPVELGFKVGMEVTITGSTSNNITFLISALDDVSITSASSLTTEAAGNEVTITYSPYIDVNAAVTTTRLDLDTHFKNTGSAIVWTFSGTYPASNTYIFNGDNAKISNKDVITFSISSTGNGTTGMYFTEGPYPKVSLTGSGSRFTPQAVSTGSTTHAFVEMESLSIGSGVLFQPNGVADLRNDAKKIFKINTTSTISLQCDTFDAGLATFEFVMDSGGAGFEIPCSGSSTYGAADKTFVAKWSGLILSTGSAGFKGYIPTNRTLAVSSIHVKEDASLVPQSSDANSTLVSISRPRIDGAWSFKQLTDGVYVSLMTDAFAVTPSDGPAGRLQLSDDAGAFSSDGKLKWDGTQSELVVDGKLTVTGLIDPTGMVFTPQASNPESTNSENTIWIDSETNHLFRGERDTESTVHFNVRNDEGSTIPVGAPLYSKGEIGGSNRIKVGIADASDPNKMPCIGLAMVEMNTTSTKDGNMILTGILNENITITSVAEQDIIYVAPHGGSAPYLTITRPTSGSHLVQNVGICVRQSASNVCQGMTVSAIGRTNDIPNATITTNSADADYVYIDDGNVFKKITPSNLGIGGGGGSGTVTSVAVTGSDGIEVDSGSPITTSGTIALGVNKTNMLSHLNVEDGADVTDATNVTAAGALMTTGGTMTGEIEGTTITLNAIPADPATDAKVRLGESGTTSNMLRIQTNDGRIDIGPNNGSFVHIQTDRDQFYFNKPILVDGGGQVFAYNDGLKLGTGTSASGGTTAITIADGSSDITVAGTTTSTGFIKTGGTSSQFLMADGSVSTGGGGGSGDVVGPSSATNNNFVAFDGTTGKLIKDSAKGAADFATAAQGALAASALQPTQAETDVFTPTTSAPFWAPPPATIQEAIDRLAAYTVQEISALGGAPVIP